MAQARTAEFVIAADADRLVKELRKAGKKVGDFADDAKGSMGKVGDAITGAFSALGPAVGAAGAVIGGVLGVTVLEALDREVSQDKLAARFLLDPDEAAKVGRIASEVYADAWGESYDDVLESASAVMQQLGDVGEIGEDSLRNLTAFAIDLRDVFEIDINEAVEATRQLMANDLVSSAEQAFDVIAFGFVNGANRADDFLETLTEYADEFEQFGFDGAEATDVLISGLEAGAFSADKVADAIREFFNIAIEDSDRARDAFTDLGLDADDTATAIAGGGDRAREAFEDTIAALNDMTDPLAQQRLGVELFGSMWEDVGGDVILSLGNIDTSLTDVDGTMQDVSDTANDNIKTRLTSAFRTVKEYVVNTFGPEIVSSIDRVMDAFDEGGLRGAIQQVGIEFDRLWNEVIKPWWDSTVYPFLMNTVVPQAEAAGEALGAAIMKGLVNWITDPKRLLDLGNAVTSVITGNFTSNLGGGSAPKPAPSPSTGGGGGGGSPGSGGGGFRVMHDGGIVPGPPRSEQLTLLEAGERVIPAGESSGATYNVTVNARDNSIAQDVIAGLRMKELAYG